MGVQLKRNSREQSVVDIGLERLVWYWPRTSLVLFLPHQARLFSSRSPTAREQPCLGTFCLGDTGTNTFLSVLCALNLSDIPDNI